MSANSVTKNYAPLLRVKAVAELERRQRIQDRPVCWVPQQPTPRQKQFLDLPHLEAFFGGSAGPGKALSVSTPIATPAGWKLMGKLEVGDEVFGQNGQPCEVLASTGIMSGHQVYRIEFDDHSHVLTDADHQWKVFTSKELSLLTKRTPEWRARRREKRRGAVYKSSQARKLPTKDAPTGSIVTTRYIAEHLLVRGTRRNFAVMNASPLQLKAQDLPVDPYVLGVWLGDGTATSAGLASADPEIVDEIRRLGWTVRRAAGKYGWIIGETRRAYRRNGRGQGLINNFAEKLRELGVAENKHVPAAYLRSSAEQRLSLLQGLMDTDGCATKDGGVEFTSTNRTLAENVHELVVSLGYKTRLAEGIAVLYGRVIGPKYRLTWTADKSMFRLPRKLARQRQTEIRRTTRMRYIVACDLVETVPVKCIAVSAPDGIFLAGRAMIPTHNSSALLMAALQYVDTPGYAALLLRKTYQDLAKPGALMDRAHQWLRGTAARWNEQKKQWTFPSTATLTFGYLENDNDKYQYQSSEFSFIGWDELTQHKESNYSYLFSRLRRLANSDVPLRMRSASNPGGVGAEWVRARFVPDDFTPDEAREMRVIYKRGTNGEGREVERAFVPATLDDNPHLDRAEYIQSLNELDAVTREQLLRGDWQIRERGNIYPMWDENYHVIGWDDFARIYGVSHIPEHWRLGVGQDWGFTEDHPCATVWVARAAEKSPLPGSVFIYRTLTTYGKTAREIAREINQRMAQHHEKDRCEMWLMSHEAASERAEYAREHALPFQAWEAGPNTGIAQVRDCLEITHREQPHPFRQQLKGRPALYCVVADDQLIHARDDRGLARLRSEISAYKYYQPKSGEGSALVRPQPLFNDTMDALRGLARKWFPSMAQMTRHERIDVTLPEPLRSDALEKATAENHSGIYYARKSTIIEQEREHGGGAKNYSAVSRYRDLKRKRGW